MYTVEKFAPFSYKMLYVMLNCSEKFYSANQSTNQVPLLGIFYSRRIIFSNAGHTMEQLIIKKFDMKTIKFKKNVLTKKGVENFSFPTVSIKA
jgi:hypothetical protein